MADRLATTDMGRKGCCAPFRHGGSWDPIHLIQCRMGRDLRTSIPSGILIHPAVWSQ